MENQIKGFAIRGYKSFGDTQYIYPLSKINLFVGQNNSGKSNILRFVLALGEINKAKSLGKTAGIPDTHLNRHQGKLNHPPEFGLPLDISDAGIAEIRNVLFKHRGNDLQAHGLLTQLLTSSRKDLDQDAWWFQYSASDSHLISPTKDAFFDQKREPKYVSSHVWQQIWNLLTNKGGGGIHEHWVPETLDLLHPFRYFNPPNIIQIQEQRKIGAAGTELNGYNGDGLIDRLAEIERPSYEKQNLKKVFEKLNSFVKEVIENNTARIEIPSDRSTINVEVDGRLLPIESLGSGIHQVIILGAAATAISNSIVCIEEPEVHLHPQLQRKLLNYLSKETSNQYFITTHSAHMLDAKSTSVFHVRLESGQSVVTLANSPTTRHSICDDLGYRASDIMQSPCVIWVEGPSDRIYLRHWLQQLDPILEEDVHYSIMFYGGRLLSHLSPSDPDVEDFISLRRLNRNLVVVIDSDKAKKSARINPTKQRVVDAFKGEDGFAWVTAGREIENYIDLDELSAAMTLVNTKFYKLAASGQFDKLLDFQTRSGSVLKNDIDKVKLAKQICSTNVNLNQFDLGTQLTKLFSYIKKSNHL